LSKKSERKKKDRIEREDKSLKTRILKEESAPLTPERIYRITHYGLYRRLEKELGIPAIEVKNIVSLVTEGIIQELLDGRNVSIYGFGQFFLKNLRPQIKTSFGRCRVFVPETTIIKFRTAESVKIRFNFEKPIKLTKWELWENEEAYTIYDDSETFKYSKEYKPREVKNGNQT
jgi:nucleoid DNA-binding protein